jgi:hypothetical protein
VIHVRGGKELKKLAPYILPQREERGSRSPGGVLAMEV